MANYIPVKPFSIARSVDRLLELGVLGDLKDRTSLGYQENTFRKVRHADGKVRRRPVVGGPAFEEAPEFLVTKSLRAVTRNVRIGEVGRTLSRP
jgi:hypothetical protein